MAHLIAFVKIYRAKEPTGKLRAAATGRMFLLHGRSMSWSWYMFARPQVWHPPAAVGHKHRFTALPDSN